MTDGKNIRMISGRTLYGTLEYVYGLFFGENQGLSSQMCEFEKLFISNLEWAKK